MYLAEIINIDLHLGLLYLKDTFVSNFKNNIYHEFLFKE